MNNFTILMITLSCLTWRNRSWARPSEYIEAYRYLEGRELCLLWQELLAQLNDNAHSESKTDEQMLRLYIDGYLSQQVFEPSLLAKYSANSLLYGEDNAINCQILQQLAALFLGMSAGSVSVECLFSVIGRICNCRRSAHQCWTRSVFSVIT